MSAPTHQQDLIALLEERGFVHQCTDREGLAAHLAAGPVTAYLGFDATADSLHVGHLPGPDADALATEGRAPPRCC
ncbi:tyrosyl-tRNA synthetase [Pseudomonas aeruginosa]|nr:tyrosyl-tRNA synthetase [Pseudomonas aeruginosa]